MKSFHPLRLEKSQEKWMGLEGGSLAKVERKSTKVSTKKEGSSLVLVGENFS